MADKTISGLPVGSPVDTDEFVIQKTGAGVNEKYTLDAIRVAIRAVAEAHSASDQTQAGITTTPVELEGYTDSGTAAGITVTLTPSGTSNRASFTVNAGKDGPYRITFNIDITSAINENIDFVIYVNGAPTNFKASVDLNNAAIDKGTAGINTFISLVAGDVVEVFANSDGAVITSMLIDSLTFTAQRV